MTIKYADQKITNPASAPSHRGTMVKAKPAEDTRTQRQKFIDATKKHGADEGTAEAFREALRGVAVRVKETKRVITRKRKPGPKTL